MPRSTELDQSVAITGVLDEVPVAKESTTSRVLVNNPLLRVVYFSFDEGEMLTDHSSPRAVVVHLVDGRMDFTVGTETSTLTAGDVIYLAPDERHALVALEPSHMSLVMVAHGSDTEG